MEIKKSPKADIENKKSTSILIGLVAAFGIMFVAFQWAQHEITVYESTTQAEIAGDEEMTEITFRDETPPPPPPPEPETVLSDIIDIKKDDEEVETAEFSTEDNANEAVAIQAPIAAPEEEDEEQKILVIVEKQPEFPGGQAALTRYLQKNVKYPPIAEENGIQGRVVCQFVVNADGKIVDVQVVRGVEESLDKEAIRVIKNMPAWTPGKQGGKNVRVRYTLPIRFKL